MTSHLFFSPSRHAEFTARLRANDPTATELAGALASEEDRESDRALHDLCLAWLNRDATAAQSAGEHLLEKLQIPHSDLGKGDFGLTFALALEMGEALWTDDLTRQFTDACADLARSITDVTKGNPHIVTNNWYMITHGGCLIACLAAHGREGTHGHIDLSRLEAWALGRFKAFMGHFGNEGLYHEGTGYIAYTCSLLLPALVALRNKRGLDLTLEFPNLGRTVRSMLMGTVKVPARQNGEPSQHLMLDWNDTGKHAAGLNPLVPGLLLSAPEDRSALKTFFDRTCGAQGINNWSCHYRGLPLAVALYPFDWEEESPGILPRHLLDTRQGMGIWRDSWEDPRATVFGWYARSTHASPGHAHDDAGSIRLISNGTSWICGAGQARANAKWQSVITHANEEDRPPQKPYAYPFTTHMGEHGGWAGIELRQVLGCYGERYLSWRTDLDAPVCLAVLDLVDEHKNPTRPFDWNLSFPKELQADVDADGRGFRLSDGENGTLHGRFLLDHPDDLTLEEMPATKRTYSSGQSNSYPGDRFVQASFRDRNHIRILVAMVVQKPGDPLPELTWQDPHIQLRPGRLWEQPFQGAILDSVRLAEHRPNLQTSPAGKQVD